MTNAVSLAQQASNGVSPGFRNRIINGSMVIDQRNAGASVTPANSAVTYTLDRWGFFVNQASKLTVQQNSGSVTPPVGFTNYLGVVSSSAYSVGSTDRFLMYQAVEGFNIADLGWGTANAKTVTLSFWVRSSLTGTFGGSLQNSGSSRCYVFSYTISAANTWEQKSITITGDTTGTWLTTNGAGIQLVFSYGTGSTYLNTAGSWYGSLYDGATGQTNLVGTNGATFYITGVQLEVGSTATSFDYRPYGTELALCQRYYQTYAQPPLRGVMSSSTVANRMAMVLPVVMRATPTAVVGSFLIYDGFGIFSVTSISASWSDAQTAELDFNCSGGSASGRVACVYQDGSAAMTLSAEL